MGTLNQLFQTAMRTFYLTLKISIAYGHNNQPDQPHEQDIEIAQGVQFASGWCVVVFNKLMTEPRIFKSIEAVKQAFCGDGRSKIVWR